MSHTIVRSGRALFAAASITAFAGFAVACSTDSNGGLAPSSAVLPQNSGTTISLASSGLPCANQPAGFTAMTDQSWNGLPPAGTKDAQGWQVMSGAKQLTIVQDAAAPRSASTVLQARWPKGMPGGGGPFHIERKFTTSATAPGYGQVYQCFYLKLNSGFTNNGNVGTKLAFFQTPYRGTPNRSEFYLSLFGNNLDLGYMAIQVSSPTVALGRSMLTHFRWPAHFGEWHQFEVLTTANTQGKADGTAKFWVDGALDFQYSDVKWFVDGVTKGTWNYMELSPTYGGGHNPVPFDMFMFIDNWYISGR